MSHIRGLEEFAMYFCALSHIWNILKSIILVVNPTFLIDEDKRDGEDVGIV